MAIRKPERVGPRIAEPPADKTPKDGTKGAAQGFIDIDEAALAALIGTKGATKLSAYFTGAPVWSPEAAKRLHGFVVNALQNNELFAGRPLATEDTAGAVCKAIRESPNLTSRFLPFLKGCS